MESTHRVIHVAGDYIAQQNIEVQVNNVASAQEYETLEKLKNSKIRYIALLMGGAGGKHFRDAHINDTAKLLNTYPPKMISIITTGIATGTKRREPSHI